jgi:transposase
LKDLILVLGVLYVKSLTLENIMRIAPSISLSEEEKTTLIKWSRGRSTPARLVQRATIVLMAQGMQNKDIANELEVMRRTVSRWRTRFAKDGLSALEKDFPRGGRHATERAKYEAAIIRKVQEEKPEHATHWTTRELAQSVGTSQNLVFRVLRANGLKPHLVKTFKISNDPNFDEKLRDVVGLYLHPPEHALVLSADEKSSIQALDRTQPELPIKKGRCGTMTHDYKRNGTTTLFAAIDMAQGKIISRCMERHRHQEWLAFLKQINRETPSDLDLHLIVDNYATHKHPKVKAWLAQHPRFHIHFTPTSSSWLNVIEGFFAKLTQQRLRRGVFKSVDELKHAIHKFIQAHNQNPTPFKWTATAEKIIEKVGRARIAMNNDPSA